MSFESCSQHRSVSTKVCLLRSSLTWLDSFGFFLSVETGLSVSTATVLQIALLHEDWAGGRLGNWLANWQGGRRRLLIWMVAGYIFITREFKVRSSLRKAISSHQILSLAEWFCYRPQFASQVEGETKSKFLKTFLLRERGAD